MSSLSDRLKALGIKVGAEDLQPAEPKDQVPVEKVVPGQVIETQGGAVFVAENSFGLDYTHGAYGLSLTSPMEVVALWAGDERIRQCPPQAFAFLDTETSGLSGGTGTYAFMVGTGRFMDDRFELRQFFMRDPTEEPGLLLALEQFLAPCQTLVSFNGKSFDVPLLNARFTLQGWLSPLKDLAHIDLLHISRRLWRDRLPNRALGSLEVDILGTSRTEQEVPGWMVPQLYFDYLRSGDARPLGGVFYHNQMDVLSMAALLNHIARMLADPFDQDLLFGQDQAALGRLYEDLGQIDLAAQIYTTSLDRDLPDSTYQDVLQRLSMLYKRQGNIDTAMDLWRQAAGLGQVYACIELAKVFEHQRGEVQQALTWTETALSIVGNPTFSRIERYQWLPELKHRLKRLERKLSGKPFAESEMPEE